jgi:apolipoprotein N-acyltransferase
MTNLCKDRVSFYSAIMLGLGISTGHPLGLIFAAGMPFACLGAETRKGAFRSASAYYMSALWPMIPGLEAYWKSEIPLIPLLLWTFTAVLLSMPWTIAWKSHRVHCFWRAPLALLVTILPPLGIIGLASPLTGAGYLFPRTAWAGLAAVALIPGILLAIQGMELRQRCAVRGFVIALCIAFTIGGRLFDSGDAKPPRRWVAVNTNFRDVSQPFRDYYAAQFIQQKAAESSARVLVFPESVIPRWSEATEAFWRQSLDRCRARGQILVIGAGLPRPNQDNIQKLSDLRLYDFGASIDALKRMDTASVHAIERSPGTEPIDNAVVVVGVESATFYQRVPVPIGMWKPFSRNSIPLRLTAPGVLNIDHQRAAVLICYEQMLTFPILASMLQHPTVIVGISNTFWVDRTTIPRYQASAVRGWAMLFRLPYLLAVNS